jgi:cell shape-determining protein MreC
VTENRVVALEHALNQLRQQNELLTKLASHPALSSEGLIPARVVARDPVGFHDPLLVNRGRSRGVVKGDYVASGMLVVHGQEAVPDIGMAVIGSEDLIGRVSQSYSLTARVRLFSDSGNGPQRVRIGRIMEEGHFVALEKTGGDPAEGRECDFLLYGKGDGLMVIEQVRAEYVEEDPASGRSCVNNPIRQGDLVVSLADSTGLPCRMVIGQVVEVERDVRNPLLYTLEVRCPVDATRLRWVYVVDMLSSDS